MSLLATKNSTWQKIRDAITTADWPTDGAKNGIDPVGTPATDRLESKMLTYAEAALPYINRAHDLGINSIDMRWRLSGSAATATMEVWGRRNGDDTDEDASMKRLYKIVITAGSQKDAAGLYFATSIAATRYFKRFLGEDAVEFGTGIMTAALDVTGYSRIYFPITAISAGSLTCEWASY